MSVTGQTGHVTVAKQSAQGTPNTTAASHRGVKITGDSMVAANNPLTANNEIGQGRDITASIPGGFSSAGSLSGNLRTRSAAVFMEGAIGPHSVVAADATGPPPTAAYDKYALADLLPYMTLEKKVGSSTRSANEVIYLRYTDCMINTLNISVPSAAFATFSAGVIACGESYSSTPIAAGTSNTSVEGTPWNASTFKAGFDPASDDILVFHGGRIEKGDAVTTGVPTITKDETFQSFEVAVNNNVASDEYTVRPSRFLRSLTEGIRSIDCNITQIFEDFHEYQQFTYGASGRTTPGYNLYMGAIRFIVANWQIIDAEDITLATLTGAPSAPQAIEVFIPRLAFSGFPITLTTGRIVVTTTAVALKPSGGTAPWDQAITTYVRPTLAGFDY